MSGRSSISSRFSSSGHGHPDGCLEFRAHSEIGGTSHQGKRTGAPLIDESLAPSHTTDAAFHGASRGGADWALKRGEVRLERDGKFDLRVKGLVFASTGTPRPVTAISASLYCGVDSNTTAAYTTQPVPISIKGDARIHDTHFTVPLTCLVPVILVHPVGRTRRQSGDHVHRSGRLAPLLRARVLTEATRSSKRSQQPKLVTRSIDNLKSAASELDTRVRGSRRSEAAKKAARTRKGNAAKRSGAARKGARTRAKSRS